MTEQLRPMTPEEVRAHATQVLEFPPFDDGTPFVARVRRLNPFQMLRQKQGVPNHLLQIAMKAMDADAASVTKEVAKEAGSEEMLAMVDLLCGNVLVEPEYDKVKDDLTQDQTNALIAYATEGVRGLEPFRSEQRSDAAAGGSGENLGDETQRPDPGSGE